MKKISLVLATTVAACVLTAVPANAKFYTTNYTMNEQLTYDNVSSTNKTQITVAEDDAAHGKVLKVDTASGPAEYELELGTVGPRSGVYSVKFDYKVSNATGGAAYLFLDVYKGSSTTQFVQNIFMYLGKGIVGSMTSDWTVGRIGSASFVSNEWVSYEIIFDFDNDEARLYQNDVYEGSFGLSENNITSLKQLHFQCLKDNVFYIDNFKVSQLTSMEVERDADNNFVVTFPMEMSGLAKENFTLYKQSLEGGVAQPVEFTVNSSTNTSITITPAAFETGNIYTVTANNNVTTTNGLGLARKSCSLDVHDVKYVTPDGISITEGDVKSTVNVIEIDYPYGMQNDTFSGTVELKSVEGAAIECNAGFNKSTNVCSIGFNTALTPGAAYTLTVSGVADKEGNLYKTITKTFAVEDTQGFEIGGLDIVRNTGVGATVTIDWANTESTSKQYAVIYAGYKNGKLAAMGSEKITVDANTARNDAEYKFEDIKIAEHDSVKAFLWSDFAGQNALVPAVPSVSK